MKNILLALFILSHSCLFGQGSKSDIQIIDGRDLFAPEKKGNQIDQNFKNINGKSFKIYIVEQGEGWYAIARKFNITYAEIRIANKDSGDNLVRGQEVLIPVEMLKSNDPYFKKNYTDVQPKSKPQPSTKKFHIVEKSQTLYSISKMYQISVGDLKRLNNLTDNSISVGQKLMLADKETVQTQAESKQENLHQSSEAEIPVPTEVNQVDLSVSPDSSQQKAEDAFEDDVVVTKEQVKQESPPVTLPVGEDKDIPKDENLIFANGRQQIIEDGVATFLEENEHSTEKYYAYHRSAPDGTIIRILNMANSRKLYVKVIGKLSDNAENEGVLIKISQSGAEKLGVTEKTFNVNLLYGLGEN